MSKYNIAIIAEAGAGKDFVAEYLIRRFGYSRYAFADNVKLVAETWFPKLYGSITKKPRELLQAVGTKFREIDENVWINAMLDDIRGHRIAQQQLGWSQEFIAVTDCRLPNEYEALKREGYTFIRLRVDKETRLSRMRERGDIFDEKSLSHHSESFYDEFECEYEIDNNGTPEELYKQIDEIVKTMAEHQC